MALFLSIHHRQLCDFDSVLVHQVVAHLLKVQLLSVSLDGRCPLAESLVHARLSDNSLAEVLLEVCLAGDAAVHHLARLPLDIIPIALLCRFLGQEVDFDPSESAFALDSLLLRRGLRLMHQV